MMYHLARNTPAGGDRDGGRGEARQRERLPTGPERTAP